MLAGQTHRVTPVGARHNGRFEVRPGFISRVCY